MDGEEHRRPIGGKTPLRPPVRRDGEKISARRRDVNRPVPGDGRRGITIKNSSDRCHRGAGVFVWAGAQATAGTANHQETPFQEMCGHGVFFSFLRRQANHLSWVCHKNKAGPRCDGFLGFPRSEEGAMSNGHRDRRTTTENPKRRATLRAKRPWAVWRRCSLLTDYCPICSSLAPGQPAQSHPCATRRYFDGTP